MSSIGRAGPAPPPTRFAVGGVQPKNPCGIGRAGPAPPPTKFAVGGVQPKAPVGLGRAGPAPPPTKFAVAVGLLQRTQGHFKIHVLQRMQDQTSDPPSNQTPWYLNDDDDYESSGSESDSEKGEKHLNKVSPEDERAIRADTVAKFPWADFPKQCNGYVRLGVHEADTEEAAASLVKNGPDAGKVGSGHGLGKGAGFYITPVGGALTSQLKDDLIYGENIVAIYIKDTAIRSIGGSQELTKLEKSFTSIHGVNKPCYYVMGAGGELLVPVRCFGSVRVAAMPEDCKRWH